MVRITKEEKKRMSRMKERTVARGGGGEREGMIDLQFTPLSHLARSFSTQKA